MATKWYVETHGPCPRPDLYEVVEPPTIEVINAPDPGAESGSGVLGITVAENGYLYVDDADPAYPSVGVDAAALPNGFIGGSIKSFAAGAQTLDTYPYGVEFSTLPAGVTQDADMRFLGLPAGWYLVSAEVQVTPPAAGGDDYYEAMIASAWAPLMGTQVYIKQGWGSVVTVRVAGLMYHPGTGYLGGLQVQCTAHDVEVVSASLKMQLASTGGV